MDYKQTFAKNLLHLRKEQHISQTRLADALRLNYRTIGMIERGINAPSFELLMKVSDYFNVSLDCLVGKLETGRGENI
ncbi:hypothetical protein FACS1894133_2260 [Clostridia bacterium]|nr:hypothetical protein FACS1894133_2260 [Clostridia bacterium]